MHSFLKSGKLDSALQNRSNKSNSSKPSRLQAWVEKYRPRTVADVVEQGDVVSVLQQCIAGGDMPNMLFYGPPGTGKTSTILAAAHQLFGDVLFRDRVLELNASDERGIQVIRDKVKAFAQLTATGSMPDGKPCPRYKIIILDEADSMTHAAQAALRRTMERETRSTRFCLICNYVSRIIEPLTSRCTKFRFKPLNEAMIFERLRYICDQEGVECGDDVLNALVEMSDGDLRRAITCLQSCARYRGMEAPITLGVVLEVTGHIPQKMFTDFLTICESKNQKQLRQFVKDFLYEAYAAAQFIEQFNELYVAYTKFTDKQKAIIGEKLGVVSYRLQEGGSEFIQLLDLGFSVIEAIKRK